MLTNADRSHLARAIVVAGQSTCRQKHGAVLATGRRVLAVGVNSFRCHPAVASDPKRESSFHAEVSVLRQLTTAPPRATLYVARVSRSGIPVLSEPCQNCRRAIKEAGVRRVVFTVEGGYGEVRG